MSNCFEKRLPSTKARFYLVPMRNLGLVQLPTEQDRATVTFAWEIDESEIEALEFHTKSFQFGNESLNIASNPLRLSLQLKRSTRCGFDVAGQVHQLELANNL